MLVKGLSHLTDPVQVCYRGLAAVAPKSLWRRYGRLTSEAGIDELYFVLSFDCDTEDDIRVVSEVDARLRDIGVRPVYAVPGELLQKGEKVYSAIARAGAEFINHGNREHTYFDTASGRHASCFFYDQQAPEIVREDVVKGDKTLRKVLGIAPRGFRTPHFGTYQKARHLSFLHQVLVELDYGFSTSTLPLFAFRFGPIFDRYGLPEIPVSGMGGRPLRILDSWGCFEAPGRRFGPDDFVREGRLAADMFAALGVGLLNFYADPSHIHDREEFFEVVACWAKVAKPVTYNELLADLR